MESSEQVITRERDGEGGRVDKLLIPLLVFTWMILCCFCCYMGRIKQDMREQRESAAAADVAL